MLALSLPTPIEPSPPIPLSSKASSIATAPSSSYPSPSAQLAHFEAQRRKDIAFFPFTDTSNRGKGNRGTTNDNPRGRSGTDIGSGNSSTENDDVFDSGSIDNGIDTDNGFSDVWQVLLRGLGEPFTSMAQLPQWINAASVHPSDWK